MEQLRTESTVRIFSGPLPSALSEKEPEVTVRKAVWRTTIDLAKAKRIPPLTISVGAIPGIFFLGLLLNLSFPHGRFDIKNACLIGGYLALAISAFPPLMRKRPKVHLEPGHPISLRLLKDGMIYAQDEGFVSFSEGRFRFEGADTTFSFSNRCISPERRLSIWRRMGRAVSQGNQWPWLSLSIEGEDYTVAFRHGHDLETDLKRWVQTPTSPVVNEVLPPIIPNAAGLSAAHAEALKAIWMLLYPVAAVGLGVAALWDRDFRFRPSALPSPRLRFRYPWHYSYF